MKALLNLKKEEDLVRMRSLPIGGDHIENYICPDCDGNNVIWEEYGSSNSADSTLGTYCEDCETRTEELNP